MVRTRRPTMVSPSTSHTILCPILKGITFRTSSGMVICHLEVMVEVPPAI
jgi:hypothetical protein